MQRYIIHLSAVKGAEPALEHRLKDHGFSLISIILKSEDLTLAKQRLGRVEERHGGKFLLVILDCASYTEKAIPWLESFFAEEGVPILRLIAIHGNTRPENKALESASPNRTLSRTSLADDVAIVIRAMIDGTDRLSYVEQEVFRRALHLPKKAIPFQPGRVAPLHPAHEAMDSPRLLNVSWPTSGAVKSVSSPIKNRNRREDSHVLYMQAITLANKTIRLRRMQAAILDRLMRANGAPVPTIALAQGGNASGLGSITIDEVRSAIYKIRQILKEQQFIGIEIVTCQGEGYKLVVPKPPQ